MDEPAAEEYLGAPVLAVQIEDQRFIVKPCRGEVTLGRDSSCDIQLNHAWLSRVHLVLRPEADHWTVVDTSRNGLYARRDRIASATIADGMTVHLGDADGLPVEFTFAEDADTDTDTDENGSDSQINPAFARAGAAVAARRKALGISQRQLASQKVVNAGALISFEKGRSWPHNATLARLEEALQWPPGAISAIRRGELDADVESTQVVMSSPDAPAITKTVQLALNGIDTAITHLPAAHEVGYAARAGELLGQLHDLQNTLNEVAKTNPGVPSLVLAMGAARRRYDSLMAATAQSPTATLGQRLYAARIRANLRQEDMALAAGLPASIVVAAEAGQPVSVGAADALTALLNQMR